VHIVLDVFVVIAEVAVVVEVIIGLIDEVVVAAISVIAFVTAVLPAMPEIGAVCALETLCSVVPQQRRRYCILDTLS
jgi:hypothetical protein